MNRGGIRTHGDVVQTIEVGEGLCVVLVLDELFGSSVKQTNVLIVPLAYEMTGISEVRTGSARRISSPFNSRIIRSTPWAAGC